MGNKLEKIHYPFETFDYNVINYQESHFDYDSNGRLKSIKDPTGICISIQYYDDGKVSRMTTYGTMTVSDQSVVESDDNPIASDIGFDYGINTASLTDMIKGTRIVYNLDSEGRELFAYEDSSVLPIEERTAVTLSSVTGYADKLDPNTKEKTTGRLIGASAYVTADASQGANLLTNNEFSSSSGWTVSENGTGSSGVVTEGFVSEKNSYRFISNEPTGENKLTQTVIPPLTPEGNVYVASVWAKASGAINTVEDERVQFALKVIAYPTGDNAEQIEYRADFDPSMNGEWQYAAIPIGATPKYSKIEYVLDYSGNTGACMFSDPMLIAIDGTERYTYVDNGESFSNADWHFYIFNEPKDIIKRVHVIEGTKFREEYYDDSHNLVKVVEHGDNSTEFETIYQYINNNLYCAKDKYGNQLDYQRDGFGRIKRIYTSPSDYSSHIMYTKRVYEDDKYYPKSETDPRYKRNGEKLITSYEYDDNLGQLNYYTAPNGQEYHYDYDSDTGNLLKLSAPTPSNGTFENAFRYTNGYLTSVSHNGFDYKFGYDELGRTAVVSVGNETLFTKSYMIGPSNDVDHTFYETGEAEYVFSDKRGNPIIRLYDDENGIQHTIATTDYDKLGRVTEVVDKLSNVKYNYTYNTDGSIAAVTKRDATTSAVISTDTYTYDSAKRLISKTYGAVDHTYSPIYECDDSQSIYPDDNVIGVTLDGKFTDQIATDGFRRTATRTLTLADDTPLIRDSYAYYTSVADENITCTCDYVTDLTTTVCDNSVGALSYTYDKAGNIETVSDGILLARYYYDAINHLTREDNKVADKTYTWSYDLGGNITEKRTYAYTTGSLQNCSYTTDSYTYAASGWKDQLTSFNDQSIISDAIGNPTTYKGNNLTWTHVRRLARYGANTFEYGADGIRTKKNGISYILDGTKILRETDGASRNITYYYGTNGVVGFNYNGTDYYYRKNLQGDVIAIYTATGTLVAEYVYDAWGRVISVRDANGNVNTNNSFIGNINSIRYRSYYYDTETGLYYLNSRYYDPETGRFINADDVQCLDPETLGGINLYAYCLDNPVNMSDPAGNAPKWWQWALAGVGIALVAVAAGMAILGTGGVAAFGIGALIGSLAAGGVGALVGGAVGYATGDTDDILSGALTGFGIGAIVGFVVGGCIGLNTWNADVRMARQFLTNNGVDSAYHDNIINSFKYRIKTKTINSDMTVYRYYSGSSRKISYWVTSKQYSNPVQRLALAYGGNTAENIAALTLQKGAQVLYGTVARVGSYLGGGLQYYVPNLAWLI